jgi:hypothetical protein
MCLEACLGSHPPYRGGDRQDLIESKHRVSTLIITDNPISTIMVAVAICSQEGHGREIKVYDDARRPREWTGLLAPSQCAVFFRRVDSEMPLSSNGAPCAQFRDCTFLLFDSLEEARRLCEAKVQQYPYMCCEIFDSKGKAVPPLLVIVHPSVAEKDELSASSVRIRKIISIGLFIGAIPLFWWDWRANGVLVLPTFLGLTIIVAGLRILYWNMARAELIREQEKRVEAHLSREKQSAGLR